LVDLVELSDLKLAKHCKTEQAFFDVKKKSQRKTLAL
jgi:hypothetical protein